MKDLKIKAVFSLFMDMKEKDVAKTEKQTSHMKLSFIEVRYNKEISLPESFLEKLPKRLILFTNIQYHPQYPRLKQMLIDRGHEVETVRPKHAWNEGQILGCSVEDWSGKNVDAFVYIGDGFFHPKAILFHNAPPVYMYDPEHDTQYTLTQKDIEKILKRRKGALVTFHTVKEVGVIVTSKYGQNRLRECFKLQEKFPEKNFYFLMGDEINFASLEDFPFLEVFVNTACPRIMDDHDKIPRPVLNIADITDEEW